jgi:hypothetical protein
MLFVSLNEFGFEAGAPAATAHELFAVKGRAGPMQPAVLSTAVRRVSGALHQIVADNAHRRFPFSANLNDERIRMRRVPLSNRLFGDGTLAAIFPVDRSEKYRSPLAARATEMAVSVYRQHVVIRIVAPHRHGLPLKPYAA